MALMNTPLPEAHAKNVALKTWSSYTSWQIIKTYKHPQLIMTCSLLVAECFPTAKLY